MSRELGRLAILDGCFKMVEGLFFGGWKRLEILWEQNLAIWILEKDLVLARRPFIIAMDLR